MNTLKSFLNLKSTLFPVLILGGLLATGSLAAKESLNFLLIMADDLTVNDASVYGGQAATPNMEALAAQGMRFDRCYQAAPMCSPTRHALYTSLYPVRSGAWPNHTYVYDGVKSIAHYLQAAGYRAGFSGKTHINPPEAFPFEYLSEAAKNKNPDFPAVDRFLADCVEQDQPFGLILCSNEPHTPWNKGDPSAYPPEELVLPPVMVDTPATRADYSKYLAEISYFDSQVGQAMELLKKYGLENNTLVVVLTEQGNAFPYAKWTCYDAGLHSGMIVRWPGTVRPGSETQALVEYIDVLPTFFDAAGLTVPDGLDGRSFLPVLTGLADNHKDYVFGLQTSRGIHNGPGYYGIRSVRDAQFRYIRNLTPEITFTNWVTKQDWWEEWKAAAADGNTHASLLVSGYQSRPAEELYNCQADPWNRHNLAGDPELAHVLQRLRNRLDQWMESQGDQGQPTELAARGRLWRHSPQNQGED